MNKAYVWPILIPVCQVTRVRPQHNYSLIVASGHTRGAPSEASEELPPGPEMFTKSCEAHRVK